MAESSEESLELIETFLDKTDFYELMFDRNFFLRFWRKGRSMLSKSIGSRVDNLFGAKSILFRT